MAQTLENKSRIQTAVEECSNLHFYGFRGPRNITRFSGLLSQRTSVDTLHRIFIADLLRVNVRVLISTEKTRSGSVFAAHFFPSSTANDVTGFVIRYRPMPKKLVSGPVCCRRLSFCVFWSRTMFVQVCLLTIRRILKRTTGYWVKERFHCQGKVRTTKSSLPRRLGTNGLTCLLKHGSGQSE